MNSRYALLALSITIAVLSLALFIAVVGGTASSVSDEALGVAVETVMGSNPDNRLLAYQGTYISQEESRTVAEPISIYLPLVSSAGSIDLAERAALMAIYNSTNGDEWYDSTGWGTDASYCEWHGITCDGNRHVIILDLRGNKISGTLPAEVGDLVRLTELRLGGTQADCNKDGCQTLYAIRDPFPPEIGKLVNLRVLDLSGNMLPFLPPEIGNLLNLQELYLGGLGGLWGGVGNQLTFLPPEIGNLLNLRMLDLTFNNLYSLPPEIGNLVNLRTLYLGAEWWWGQGGNPISALPAEIGNLVNLQLLDLSYNQLAFLPEDIGKLVNLRGLRVKDNSLYSLTPEISNLASLQDLNLGNNQLSGPIPAYLSNLGDLTSLTLWGNTNLTCWETEEARDWALTLSYYGGPTCVLSK